MAKEIKINSEEELRPKMAQAWEIAKEATKSGPFVVRFLKPSKTRDQESRYHAMINDIHRQGFRASTFPAVKAVLVNQFAKELESMGEPLANPGQTAWDWVNEELVSIRPSTKDFSVKEGSKFIEWLYALGADLEIQWSEPAMKAWEEYKEAK